MGSLSTFYIMVGKPVFLTLCWWYTNVFSEERAPHRCRLYPPRDWSGYLLDTQVDELAQRKSNHHVHSGNTPLVSPSNYQSTHQRFDDPYQLNKTLYSLLLMVHIITIIVY